MNEDIMSLLVVLFAACVLSYGLGSEVEHRKNRSAKDSKNVVRVGNEWLVKDCPDKLAFKTRELARHHWRGHRYGVSSLDVMLPEELL